MRLDRKEVARLVGPVWTLPCGSCSGGVCPVPVGRLSQWDRPRLVLAVPLQPEPTLGLAALIRRGQLGLGHLRTQVPRKGCGAGQGSRAPGLGGAARPHEWVGSLGSSTTPSSSHGAGKALPSDQDLESWPEFCLFPHVTHPVVWGLPDPLAQNLPLGPSS